MIDRGAKMTVKNQAEALPFLRYLHYDVKQPFKNKTKLSSCHSSPN